jgi:nickel-type superoxide dismutase maturation protease
MLPTFRPGDWLVIRRGGRPIRTGDVVVAMRPDRTALLIVKRAVRRDGQSWWLLGDNAQSSDDSRLFGAVPDANLVGRVAFRYWPLRRTNETSAPASQVEPS